MRMGSNKVFLNKHGFIEIIYIGNQTAETIDAISEAGQKLASKLRQEKKPILALANMEKIGLINIGARRRAAAYLKTKDYNKIACFGANTFVRTVGNIVVDAVHKSRNVKFFTTRSEAVVWLRENRLESSKTNKPKTIKNIAAYRASVDRKLEALEQIISAAVIGEYSEYITIPEEKDEFMDVFVGVRLLVETLEEKARTIRDYERAITSGKIRVNTEANGVRPALKLNQDGVDR